VQTPRATPVPPIDLAIDVPVAPATAWLAITDPARVADWLTEASALGSVGAPYRLDFGDGSIVGGEVRAVEPGRSFTHTWHWEGAEESETTTVTWSVAAASDGGVGSRIRLVHDGWAEAGLDRAARDDHEGYWTGYLEDLQAVLTEA
jgi:uncharacterized protein YndB with AHSA1/START domain